MKVSSFFSDLNIDSIILQHNSYRSGSQEFTPTSFNLYPQTRQEEEDISEICEKPNLQIQFNDDSQYQTQNFLEEIPQQNIILDDVLESNYSPFQENNYNDIFHNEFQISSFDLSPKNQYQDKQINNAQNGQINKQNQYQQLKKQNILPKENQEQNCQLKELEFLPFQFDQESLTDKEDNQLISNDSSCEDIQQQNQNILQYINENKRKQQEFNNGVQADSSIQFESYQTVYSHNITNNGNYEDFIFKTDEQYQYNSPNTKMNNEQDQNIIQEEDENSSLLSEEMKVQKILEIKNRRNFLRNYKKKKNINTAHIPTNFMNVLIPFLLQMYEMYVKCQKNLTNSKKVSILKYCYKYCSCRNCKEYEFLKLKKSNKKNQNIKDLREMWQNNKRFQILTEHFLLNYSLNTIKQKCTYRNLEHKESLLNCLEILLKNVRNPDNFYKIL